MRGDVLTVLFGTTAGWLAPVLAVHPNPSDFFADRTVLEFIVSTDLSILLADRDLDSPERPGQIGFRDTAGTRMWLPVKVKTRGKFRLVGSVCDFPPIRLNFPKHSAWYFSCSLNIESKPKSFVIPVIVAGSLHKLTAWNPFLGLL